MQAELEEVIEWVEELCDHVTNFCQKPVMERFARVNSWTELGELKAQTDWTRDYYAQLLSDYEHLPPYEKRQLEQHITYCDHFLRIYQAALTETIAAWTE